MSSFCTAKATHTFAAKMSMYLNNTIAIIVNELVINELVKLMMLATTGPRTLICTTLLVSAFVLFIKYYSNSVAFTWNFNTGCHQN